MNYLTKHNTNTNINKENTYFIQITPKKDIIVIQHKKSTNINQISLNSASISWEGIYSKGKMQKTLRNINNIIINKNTNITNNTNNNFNNNIDKNNNNENKEFINQ